MESNLSVPPINSFFINIVTNLQERSKFGLFCQTGMGKSRILLYLANWWIQQNSKNEVYIINSPLDISLDEWDEFYSFLKDQTTNNPSDKLNPLIIIDDFHTLTKESYERIKKLISGSSHDTWKLIVAYTELNNVLTLNKNPNNIFFHFELREALRPHLEIFNLTKIWPIWRNYFSEWLKWVREDVLKDKFLNVSVYNNHHNINSIGSPWSLVVSLGFLKKSLKETLIYQTENNFPAFVYGLISVFFALLNESKIPFTFLKSIISKYCAKFINNLNFENELIPLLKTFSNPLIRLLPPLEYESMENTIDKELLIPYHHLAWVKESISIIRHNGDFDFLTLCDQILIEFLPTVYHVYQLTKQVDYSFCHWCIDNVRIKLLNKGDYLLTYLNINSSNDLLQSYKNLTKNNITGLTHSQLMNHSFIISVLKN